MKTLTLLLISIAYSVLFQTHPLARTLTLKSDTLTYHEASKTVKATGQVTLVLDTVTINASSLVFHTHDNTVSSDTPVFVQRDNRTIRSSSLFITLDNNAITLTDIAVALTLPHSTNGQLYVTIDSLISTQKKQKGIRARFSTCPLLPPHYSLSAWAFYYYPNKRIHLIGAQLYNPLTFFPFSLIPFPIPIIEWIPIPYYTYQLGTRKRVLNFPTIGQKNSPGWGFFVQNRYDYRRNNNQDSSLLLDWYEAKGSRRGEWGYGIDHHYGHHNHYGSIYVYTYPYTQDNQPKNNTVLKVNHNSLFKNVALSGQYHHFSIDERINSSTSYYTTKTHLKMIHDQYRLPFTVTLSEINSKSNRYLQHELGIEKIGIHQSATLTVNTNKNDITNRKAVRVHGSHTHQHFYGFIFKQNSTFTHYTQHKTNSPADQQLLYTSSIEKTLPHNIHMTVVVDYLNDLDNDRVTVDSKTGLNNYLYKLPEISLTKTGPLLATHPWFNILSSTRASIGFYQEVREGRGLQKERVPLSRSHIEPNVYIFEQHLSKKYSNIPIGSTLHLDGAYTQYIFKNKNVPLLKGDAQYFMSYKTTLKSTLTSWATLTSFYSRSHGHTRNNSPFLYFKRTENPAHTLYESLDLTYSPSAKTKLTWKHQAGYNWLKSSNPYTNYQQALSLDVANRHHLDVGFSKNLNKKWTKENQLFTPLIIQAKGCTLKDITYDYSVHFNLNDIVFNSTYTVQNSVFSTSFPLGKNKDFQWSFRTVFNFKSPGKPMSLGEYQLQQLAIVKKEHERQLEIGYTKSSNELTITYTFLLFPDDPLILKRRHNNLSIEGRLSKNAEERLK